MLEKRISAHHRSHQHLILTIRIQVQRRKLYYAQENLEPNTNCVILGFFLHQKEIQKLQIRYRRVFIPTQSTIGGEKHPGGGGSSSSRSLGFRISAMAGGRRARRKRRETRSLTVRAGRRDDDEKSNSRPLRTRRSRPSSSTADERLHLLLPIDDEKPHLVRKVYPTWYFRPSVTTKLRLFVYLRGGLLIPPPPLSPFQLFQSRGLFLTSSFNFSLKFCKFGVFPPKV
jgi:hypothetical protein